VKWLRRLFESPEARVRRLRAELRDIDSWIPCLERYIDEKRARRQQILLELVEVEQPDDAARRCGAL